MRTRTRLERALRLACPTLASLLFTLSAGAQIAAWDFFGESSPATSTADIYVAGLDASNVLTRGAGASASTATNSFRTQGFQNNGISTANTDFFQFTLSAAPGSSLSLSTIDAIMAGTGTFSASPGTTNQFAYSLDGTNFTLIGSPIVRIGNGALTQTDLTGIPALQNLPDGVNVTFRFYASGQTATGGWGFNSPASGQYGLSVGGTITASSTSVSLAATSNVVSETAGSTSITVNISNPDAVNATTVDLVLLSGDATRAGNYTTQTVSFAAGSSTPENVVVTITDNGVSDGDATLVFQLQNVAGGTPVAQINSPSTFTLTIEDDEALPTVSINSVTLTEGNSGTSNAVVSVTMNAQPASTVDVSVTDALTGSASSITDYAFTPASLQFLTSETYPNTKTLTISVLGDTDLEPNETVNYAVSITSGPASLGLSTGTLTIVNDDVPVLFINEVDGDQTGADTQEFIELFGAPNTSLLGTTLVLFNGSNDLSYASYDLDAYSLDGNGFFVIGNAATPGVDLVFADNFLQNGADAVALYYADAISFPNNTAVTTVNLIDALVYDTDDADDAGLLPLINGGQAQVNENANAASATQSMSRVPDGGVLRDTDTYAMQLPTPGATNVNPCSLVLGTTSTSCNTVTTGPGDTYTLSIPYTGVQAGVTVINNGASGTVGGDDPATVPNGTITVSGISEADGYNVSFSAPCGTLSVSGSAPSCEPPPPPPTLVINEVDYDQSSTDAAEFIELKNTGTEAVDLTGLRIELINGSNGLLYSTINLSSVSLAAGDYYVIGHAIVPNVDQVAFTTAGSIQNGAPDGMRLMTATNVIVDQLSYEGTMSTTEGTGAGADTNDDVLSLARFPDGIDTQDNSVDFAVLCITPGAANSFSDIDNDGTLDCLDVCANGPEPGSPCDDGNASTGNDVIQANCTCAGETTDCLGVVGGTALPGTSCDDGDPDTVNDVYLGDCTCLGTPVCSTDLVIEFQTDANPNETTWEIRTENGVDLVQSGGPLNAPNGVETNFTCLPDGCFTFRVLDGAGDGMTSGGYILRTLNTAERIIDNRNNFSTGSTSAISGGQGFCLPMSSDKVIFTSCDKLDWVSNQYVVATPNAVVSAQWLVGDQTNDGYEFWIFDPNGSYSFRRFRNHATSDGFGPASATRACHMKLNNWAAVSHVPANVLMNVRVRARVNGVNGQFGPACRLAINPTLAACPLTQLMNIPGDPNFSCGATRAWGTGNLVHARPVSGANRYQFRFRIPAEGFSVTRTSTTYFTQLNWAVLPLQDGKTYDVDVRVSKDGGATWCSASDPWGPVCQLTIDNTPAGNGNQNFAGISEAAELLMFPNPNRGDVLNFSINAIEEGVNTVSVDIYDLTGKRMSARTIAVADGNVNTVIDLNGVLAAGMYLVNITAGDNTYTERLVIQP